MRVIAVNSNIDFLKTNAPEKSSLTSELDTHSTQSHLIWCGLGMVTYTEQRHDKKDKPITTIQNKSKKYTLLLPFLHIQKLVITFRWTRSLMIS